MSWEPPDCLQKRPEEVSALLEELESQWVADDYDCIHKNCCHFCREFATRLGVAFPDWVSLKLVDKAAQAEGVCGWAEGILRHYGSALPQSAQSQRSAACGGA